MSKFKTFFKKFINNKKLLISSALGVVALLLIAFLTLGNGSEPETIAPNSQDLVRTVRIAGKVTPREKVDLGFEISGTVSSVGKSVGERVSRGETLARLSSGTISAEITKAEAELASAVAELSRLEGGSAYESSINNSKRTLTQTIKDAYTSASDSISNKADQTFVDPRGNRPEIAGTFLGYGELRTSLREQRLAIGLMLPEWQIMVSKLGPTYSDKELELTKKYLEQTITFISDVSRAVNMFEVSSSMTQTTIDKYKSDILSARESLNSISQKIITGEDALASLLSDVPVQVARVEAERASVLNLRFQLDKTSIQSPISGTISRQDAKLGQAVTAGTELISVISPDYVIETYVPEVLIAGIALGNNAEVTLDAYGPTEKFLAKVEHIDPAETIRDGVSTYKVKLTFQKEDSRVRSGMTANVEIETLRKSAVQLIPKRAVIEEGEKKFVYVLDPNGKTRKVEVTLGESDSSGNVEILSGVSETDRISVTPTAN